jgi:hypothetical protein
MTMIVETMPSCSVPNGEALMLGIKRAVTSSPGAPLATQGLDEGRDFAARARHVDALTNRQNGRKGGRVGDTTRVGDDAQHRVAWERRSLDQRPAILPASSHSMCTDIRYASGPPRPGRWSGPTDK